MTIDKYMCPVFLALGELRTHHIIIQIKNNSNHMQFVVKTAGFYDIAECIPFVQMWFANLYLDHLDITFKSRIYTQ